MPDFLKTCGMIAKASVISALGGGMCYLIKLFFLNHSTHNAGFFRDLFLIAFSGIPSMLFIYLVLEVSKISNTRVIIKRLLKRAE